MFVIDEQLSYEHHAAELRRMGLLNEGAPDQNYWHTKAASAFYYHIHDALSNLMVEVIALSSRMHQGPALEHLRFGAGRRLKIIWQGIRDLFAVAPPERQEPMISGDVDTAARALNDIYIHSLGTLDNYTHALGWHLAGEPFSALRNTKKTLLDKEFLKCCGSPSLRRTVEPYRNWIERLKSLRDPVAHRIPLTVPPAIITDKSRAEWEAANEAYQSALGSPPPIDGPESYLAVEEWSSRVAHLLKRLETVGEFRPWIAHDPRAEVVPIYPTVLEDVARLILMCRSLNKLFVDGVEASAVIRTP